ncbi:MAG: hypothetical protein JWM33_1581 [Caulobacteraceae bacterium]|nr:hypothetical protein [Caulobacteraceae bacterium]
MALPIRLALVLALAAGGAHAASAPFASDPTGWWSTPQTVTENRLDPLARRSPTNDQATVRIDGGVDPLLYRLWGLPPLQSQLLRRDETILEVWYHPTASARQAVARLVMRSDGRAFVQARAGLACCKPEIDRRVDIDVEITPPKAALEAISEDPLWRTPKLVAVRQDRGDDVSALCAGGAAYDLTLVRFGLAYSLHRACDPAEIGQVASALELALGSAIGRDPRFDAVFAKGADFSAERTAYRQLLAGGGSLAAAPPAGPPN